MNDEPTIHCERCHAVCCRLKVLVLPGDDPPDRYLDRDEHGMFIMAKSDDGWCVALDRESLRCTIYQRRPWVCREFAMGGTDCRDERADWRRIMIALE